MQKRKRRGEPGQLRVLWAAAVLDRPDCAASMRYAAGGDSVEPLAQHRYERPLWSNTSE